MRTGTGCNISAPFRPANHRGKMTRAPPLPALNIKIITESDFVHISLSHYNFRENIVKGYSVRKKKKGVSVQTFDNGEVN